MLSGEIEVNYGIIDNNACVSFANVKGTPFFSFAIKETEMIKKSLKSKTATAYDDEQVTYELAAFEYQWDRKDPTGVMGMQRNNEWIALREDIQIRYYNLVYNISTTDKQRYLTDETLPYNLFYKKWYSSYERYVRNLYLILQFICEEVSTRDYLVVKYTRFLQAQMNMAELEFIKIHAQSFPAFREILVKTRWSEIINQSKICI